MPIRQDNIRQQQIIPNISPTEQESILNTHIKLKDRSDKKNIIKEKERILSDLQKHRRAEANKYTIPYIEDKEISLTNGRLNTGKISTNILDSLYNSAKRVGVPIVEALGLASRESTLGIAQGLNKHKKITGTELLSNWQQITPRVILNSEKNRFDKIRSKIYGKDDISDEDIEEYKEAFSPFEEAYNTRRSITSNPIDDALKLYKSGAYNRNSKGYNDKVRRDGEEAIKDVKIREWLNSKNE